jgi:hypothetical protein
MKEENKINTCLSLTTEDLDDLIKTECPPQIKSNINNLFNTLFFLPENESELIDDTIQKVNGTAYTDQTLLIKLGPAVYDKQSGVLTVPPEISKSKEFKIKTGGYE